MNMEYILQELCKKIEHMDKQSFEKMIKRLTKAYNKKHISKINDLYDLNDYED